MPDFPTTNEATLEENADDRALARALDLLASAVESSPNSELLLLRISTCRNAYMTANTLFVAIKTILGHGQQKSRLERCSRLLLDEESRKLRALLDESSAILKEFSKKVAVWERRAEFDAQLEKAIASLPKLAERGELRSLLFNVRSDVDGCGQYDKRYVALSTAEPSYVSAHIQCLREMHRKIVACIEALLAASELALPTLTGPSLFGDESSMTVDGDQWKTLFDHIVKHATVLNVRVDSDGQHVILLNIDRAPAKFTATAPTIDEARQFLGNLAHRVLEIQNELHDELCSRFAPNVGRRPLPSLFKIDLTERLPAGDTTVTTPAVRVVPLGGTQPACYTLALPTFGFPQSWYRDQSGYMRFKDERVVEADRAIESAICVAAQNQAHVLVLPEYAVPRASEQKLISLAREKNIALIGGLEAAAERVDHADLLVNEAVVWLPEVNDAYRYVYRQRKRTASVYESALSSDSVFFLFSGSRLGNLGVLVCSDFREMDILSAYGAAGVPIDCLILCSMNPCYQLFEQLALADAQRLHACVVIANNCFERGNPQRATANGSGTFWPVHIGNDDVPQIRRGNAPIALGLPDIGGQPPGLSLQDVPVADLVRNGAKLPKGFLPPPRCRST